MAWTVLIITCTLALCSAYHDGIKAGLCQGVTRIYPTKYTFIYDHTVK